MKKLLTIVFVLVLTGVAFADEELLVPAVACTQPSYLLDGPPCNAYRFADWYALKLKVKTVFKDPAEPLPACEPDGNGICPFFLQAKGKLDDTVTPAVFYVTEWSKAANTKKEGPYEAWMFTAPTPPQVDPVSEAERKKALDAWMKDLKKQSDASMEKLKKENPEQYQKLQQLLNALQNAAPAATPGFSRQGK